MVKCPLSVCVLTLNEAHNIAACLATGSILPAMYVGLPTFYGAFMTIFFGLIARLRVQHSE